MREDSLTKRLWLHILAEGGRWTVSELTMDLREDLRLVNAAVSQMHSNGLVVQIEKTDDVKKFRYGVTKACKIPQAVTVEEFTVAATKALAL